MDMVQITADSQGQTPGAQGQGPMSLVRPDLLGVAFQLAWLCLFMYNVMPGFVVGDSESFDVLNPIYLFSMLSTVAMLLFGIFRLKTFMRFARSRAGVISMPLVCAAGTLCYTLCSAGIVPQGAQTAVLVAGGVLTGVSSAVMASHWASVFGRARARAVIANFTVILACVIVACLAISYLSPTPALAVATLLPLASGACLAFADKHGTTGRHTGAHPGAKHKYPAYAALIAAVALLGVSTGCLPRLSLEGLSFDQVFYSIGTFVILAMMAWLLVREEPAAFMALFAVPVAVVAVFALPYLRFTANSAADLFYIVGNASIELMLLFASVLFALLLDFSCARTYMVVRVAMALSDFAGAFLAGQILSVGGDQAAVQLAGTAILVGSEVVIGALLLVCLLLRNKSLPAPELNRQAAGMEEQPGTERAQEPEAAQGEDAVDDPADATEEAVRTCIEKFGLSPREADVLRLLVAGDSTAQIQDKLCIAPGTFNYHMRNIYSKLGVHSRQELLVGIYNQAKQ